MNIGVLTSSRADFGIYLPLLKKLKKDRFFNLSIIAFGTHLSPFHGHTVDQIYESGFHVKYKIESILAGDSANAVSSAMGLTMLKFADFWAQHANEFDLVLCLGDRYEMFAAVAAGIPFGVNYAHFHGGERTLGAIDNIFRHAITLASSFHFVATDKYRSRVEQLTESTKDIYVVGALGLDNLKQIKLLTTDEFKKKFNIDLTLPTILCTVHPETVGASKNKDYACTLIDTFKELSNKYHIVITLPNADTQGTVIREAFLTLPKITEGKVICKENLGTLGYFSCMAHSHFMLGNTSSGIIEAASLQKRVINIGNRQEGRAVSENIIQCPIDKDSIIAAVGKIEKQPIFKGENIYAKGGAVSKIIGVLKNSSI